jgi:methylated-DNA-[protein]-cysteine S-methyltransferase
MLPALEPDCLQATIRRRFPHAEELPLAGEAARAADLILTLAETGRADLSDLCLDMNGQGETYRQIYDLARTIAPGATLTYGEIAGRIGGAADARTVGQAMGRNPWPIIVPCHRVLGAGGRLVGFSAPGGVDTKLKLLAIERARVGDAPGLFDDFGGLPIGVCKT